jgi:hypothetical protein
MILSNVISNSSAGKNRKDTPDICRLDFHIEAGFREIASGYVASDPQLAASAVFCLIIPDVSQRMHCFAGGRGAFLK